jgi:hypothetical protein
VCLLEQRGQEPVIGASFPFPITAGKSSLRFPKALIYPHSTHAIVEVSQGFSSYGKEGQ